MSSRTHGPLRSPLQIVLCHGALEIWFSGKLRPTLVGFAPGALERRSSKGEARSSCADAKRKARATHS
jgi:hypothetical protein